MWADYRGWCREVATTTLLLVLFCRPLRNAVGLVLPQSYLHSSHASRPCGNSPQDKCAHKCDISYIIKSVIG